MGNLHFHKVVAIFAADWNLRQVNMERRNLKLKPQWEFDSLYVPPFTKQRGFDAQTLTTVYVPLQFERTKTGVAVLDSVVDKLIAGQDPRRLAYEWGMTRDGLSQTLRSLTGMTLQEMVTRWHSRKAEELLRYTKLPLSDIQRRCGFASSTAFSRFVKDQLGVSPLHFRQTRRKAGDLGKYAV